MYNVQIGGYVFVTGVGKLEDYQGKLAKSREIFRDE